MAQVTISTLPLGRARMRWYDGATLKATEDWIMANSEYAPLGELIGRVRRLEGLSVNYQTSAAAPRTLSLRLSCEGVEREVSERLVQRYTGTDGTAIDWNSLKLLFDDPFGNEWQVKLAKLPLSFGAPRVGGRFQFEFFVEAPPVNIRLMAE